MLTTSTIIAASQLLSVALAAPLLNTNSKTARGAAEYKIYGGDGTEAQGWPSEDSWKSYEELWDINKGTMTQSCTQFDGQKNDEEGEIADIKSAIEQVAKETSLDPRFLLVIVMQESKGCVRAPTTNYGFDNPGLMQSFQGKHSCNPDGNGISPCPKEQIVGMIQDGAGVGLEAGLMPALKQAAVDDVSKYYKAARIYNSGSIASSGLLGDGIATHCYASDVANRFVGWDGENTKCDEEAIKTAGPSGGGDSQQPSGEQPTGTQNQTPAQTQAPAGGDSPSGDKAEGASPNCTKWYTVKEGDSCESTGIDIATLVSLNTSLKDDCSNLWSGSAYCVAA